MQRSDGTYQWNRKYRRISISAGRKLDWIAVCLECKNKGKKVKVKGQHKYELKYVRKTQIKYRSH